jgi:hypothetical protein
MTNFQRDPSFSVRRMSTCSNAWLALIDHFNHRGVGRIVGLPAQLLDSEGEIESIDAFLQLILHNYQDINEDSEFMVSEKISLAASTSIPLPSTYVQRLLLGILVVSVMLFAVLYSLLVAVGQPYRGLRRPPSLSSHFSSHLSRAPCGAGTTYV